MNFIRFSELSEYWSNFPPEHVGIRHAFGAPKGAASDSPDLNTADISKMPGMDGVPIVKVPRG